MGRSSSITDKLIRAARNPRQALDYARLHWLPYDLVEPKDPMARQIWNWCWGSCPRVELSSFLNRAPAEEALRLYRPVGGDAGTTLSPLELLALATLARQVAARNLLEIGTFDGNTAVNLVANAAPGAKLTTVDLPVDWNGETVLDVPEKSKNVTDRTQVGRRIQESDFSERITQIFADSAALDWRSLSPDPFDFVFIDGCHDYAYVKKDTDNALEVIRPGGMLVWHDYAMFSDVSRAVDERAEALGVQVIQGTRLAVGRTPEAKWR